MDSIECVVVGAGVVGLAVARALALHGREVLLLEACHAIGTQTSSRNSEVIHAGIYYAAGSLKALLCVRGKSMLYRYCAERGIAHRRCGKLIVATQANQWANLHAIRQRAQANGVMDLEMLSAGQARALEPALAAQGALLSPSTGIVDSHALMLSLLGDFENAGGCLALNSPLRQAQQAQGAMELIANDGTTIACRCLVNAAGHQAPTLARAFLGLDSRHVPTPHYAKGNYFSLAGRSPFSRLIYPVPEDAGLGVHLTLDLGGQARFGPDVHWVDSPDDLAVNPERGAKFYQEIRKYWPALADAALLPAYAGIRPKIHGPHEPATDFCIQGPHVHGVEGLVNLFGIESPGLTASLAIGQHVADLLVQ
jgi:L-2-hydroxyglutarate oxidase LhgO